MQVQNYINGEWVGDPEHERRNPARPDEVVAIAPRSGAAVVAEAVAGATEAQVGWSRTPGPARGAILLDAADLLRERQPQIAEDLVREEGKLRAEAMGEVRRAIDVLRFFGAQGWAADGQVLPSSLPQTQVLTSRVPIGVAGVITPWNFPIAIPAWKTAPALISGNAVVLKPAELTPLSATHLVRALLDAGLPAGVLNLVHGRGSVIGEALVNDERVGAISFTGSTEVGLVLQQAVQARRARVQTEMGGKNAYLVLDDADAVEAAKVVAAGAFSLTGQACTATSRVYVTPGIRATFLEALAQESAGYRPGDGLAEGSSIGPVVSQDQLDTDLRAVQSAREAGATVVAGGVEAEGLLLAPTVLSDVAHESDVARAEIFGPVLAVLEAEGYEEGLALVNDSRFGLAAGICTTSLKHATDFAERAQAGVIKVNRPTTGLDLNVPFGGIKESSTNTFREQGATAVDFYTWGKTVYVGQD